MNGDIRVFNGSNEEIVKGHNICKYMQKCSNETNLKISSEQNFTNYVTLHRKTEMILNRLFVPSNCLQGGELPVHLLWSRDKKVKIKIEIPKSFEILRIYNTEDARIQEDGFLSVSEFEENGFFGFVLKTPHLSEYAHDEDIIFEIVDSKGVRDVEIKHIHLFRPSVKIISIPNQIVISKDKNQNLCQLESKILISNEGEGLAVVDFMISEDSELKIVEPDGAAQFTKNFWIVWSKSLEKLKSAYSEHADLIDRLISLGTKSYHFDETGIERLRDVFEKLEIVLQSDSPFSKEFITSLGIAYMKNIHLITEMESFVTYLKSIELNKIIVNDPISVLKVGREPKKFKAQLTMVDLGYNAYEPIPIELELKADQDCEVPIHSILAVVNGGVK